MSSQPPSRLTPHTPPQRPEPTAIQSGEPSVSTATLKPPKKKRNHRGGKKKRARRQSFATSTEDGVQREGDRARDSFYRVQGRNMSGTSIESEALLDHRYVMNTIAQVLNCMWANNQLMLE